MPLAAAPVAGGSTQPTATGVADRARRRSARSSPAARRRCPGTARSSRRAAPAPSPTLVADDRSSADCSKQLNIGAAGIPAALLKHLTFKCGKVPVPLNYDNPTGPTIEIEVLRMHDDQAPAKLPALLMNPGGPGASGLALPIELAGAIADAVLTHYDLVGFDPRGIGLSNSLQCVTDRRNRTRSIHSTRTC